MATRRKTRSKVTLNPTQFDALWGLVERCLFDLALYIGGRGSGKSVALGFFIYMMTRLPYSVTLLTAPTFDTLNNSTLPGVLEAWSLMGLEEGVDYVFGEAPKSWRVRSHQKLRKYKCITWRNGSVTLLDGSDNFNKHRGIELDAVGIDEFGNLKEGALKVYIGGLRGKATKKAGKEGKIFGVGNPPEDPYQVEQWEGKDRTRVFLAATHENAKNLPKNYIARMAAMYDEITYDREVLGKLIGLGGLKACSSFIAKPYPEGNLTRQDVVLDADTWMTWDFNASMERPMSTLIYQRIDGRDVVVKEFINLGTNTHDQCDIIFDWLTKVGFAGKLMIRGDATGGDAARGSAATQSDYNVIETAFRSTGLWKYKGHKTRRTRRVKNRMAALNARLRTKDGTVSLLVDERCVKLIEAAKQLKWASNSYNLEENQFRDPIDAWSYGSYTDHPVHFRTAEKTKRR